MLRQAVLRASLAPCARCVAAPAHIRPRPLSLLERAAFASVKWRPYSSDAPAEDPQGVFPVEHAQDQAQSGHDSAAGNGTTADFDHTSVVSRDAESQTAHAAATTAASDAAASPTSLSAPDAAAVSDTGDENQRLHESAQVTAQPRHDAPPPESPQGQGAAESVAAAADATSQRDAAQQRSTADEPQDLFSVLSALITSSDKPLPPLTSARREKDSRESISRPVSREHLFAGDQALPLHRRPWRPPVPASGEKLLPAESIKLRNLFRQLESGQEAELVQSYANMQRAHSKRSSLSALAREEQSSRVSESDLDLAQDRIKEGILACATEPELWRWAEENVWPREGEDAPRFGMQTPFYATALAELLIRFRDTFNNPYTALSIYQKTKDLGIQSQVFGCGTLMYREVIRTQWNCLRDLPGVLASVQEARRTGVLSPPSNKRPDKLEADLRALIERICSTASAEAAPRPSHSLALTFGPKALRLDNASGLDWGFGGKTEQRKLDLAAEDKLRIIAAIEKIIGVKQGFKPPTSPSSSPFSVRTLRSNRPPKFSMQRSRAY